MNAREQFVEELKATMLANGVDAVYGAVDWNAIAAWIESRQDPLRDFLERMLADDTANIGWVHGQRVFTEERLRRLLWATAEVPA